MENFLQKIELVYKNDPQAIALIKRAYETAEKAHQGQKRSSGEPYFIHCVETANTLVDMRLDATTVATGLLHDTAEDTNYSLGKINKDFGNEIAFIMEGITKLGKIKYRGNEEKAENLRKMLLAMAEDIRVILIKLADRLHNMKTLQFVAPEKQRRIALETLDIYAPLAHRLGMGDIKGQLEDLAFKYLHPEEYEWVARNVAEKYQEREKYLEEVKPIAQKELLKENIIPIAIDARAKHYWSLYKKLLKYDMNFEKVYDLMAVRIVVNTIEECYATLGIIHKLWRPVIGKIKDYIALPKPNGYQSLHTTVFCIDGKITEFQIRTSKMHEEAEKGIAAHWLYTEKGKPKGEIKTDNRFSWVSQLREWQNEMSGSQEFLDSLKIDFFKDRIFAMTPKGDAIDLPEGATPIDFAYHIHSDIGDHCAGAKVGGKMVPLSHQLQNGDVVEIIVQKKQIPSRAWLEFTKTNNAKNRIRHALKKDFGIEIASAKKQTGNYRVELKIICVDRMGLLKDISETLHKLKINIESINTLNQPKHDPATITVVFSVKKRTPINKVITKLKQIKSVEEINHKITQ